MTAELWEGDIFAGKYRVERVIGQGAMGMVIGARHLGLDEPVAIKVLLPAVKDIPGMVERFVREARAAAKIRGEHVVRVADVDTLPSGVPFMVMELLEGADLSDLCEQRGRLGIDETVRYVRQACAALADAHAMGIVHRDIKPENLFLAKRRDGSTGIKVLDFGISKVSHGDHSATSAGTVLGSPSYMSPEQMLSPKDVDGRADIWALGVVLYEMLTGAVPFSAESLPQLCSMVMQATPKRPSELRNDVPPGLEAVILRCLQKDPRARYGTAGELSAALAPFGPDVASGSFPGSVPLPRMSPPSAGSVMAQSMSGSVPGTVTTASPSKGSVRVVVAGVAVAALVAIGIAAAVLVPGRNPSVTAKAPVTDVAPPKVETATRPAEPTVVPAASSPAESLPSAPVPAPTAPTTAASAEARKAKSPPVVNTPPRGPKPAAPPKPAKPIDPFQGARK